LRITCRTKKGEKGTNNEKRVRDVRVDIVNYKSCRAKCRYFMSRDTDMPFIKSCSFDWKILKRYIT